jgi:hypothetical protein
VNVYTDHAHSKPTSWDGIADHDKDSFGVWSTLPERFDCYTLIVGPWTGELFLVIETWGLTQG